MKNERFDFRILGLDHLALAPKDPLKAKSFFEDILGLVCVRQSRIESQSVDVSMLELKSTTSHIEILDNSHFKSGVIRKYIEKIGGGIHHLALRVERIDQLVSHLKSKGVELINEAPSEGEGHSRIIFIHPKATGGILVELVERI